MKGLAGSDDLIVVDDIGKVLHGAGKPQKVLAGASFAVQRCQTVAILGRSGSGKSTLLGILALFDRFDSGSYRFNGVEMNNLSERQACRLRSDHFGFVFQRFFLLKHLTAEENVAVPLVNGQSGISRRDRLGRSRSALERMGIAHLARRRPGELSGGEQQRVAIARALIRDPLVVFADEPTGALDSHTGQDVVDLLISLSASGTAVVMVTHDREHAERLDRVLLLEDGCIRDTRSTSAGSR